MYIMFWSRRSRVLACVQFLSRSSTWNRVRHTVMRPRRGDSQWMPWGVLAVRSHCLAVGQSIQSPPLVRWNTQRGVGTEWGQLCLTVTGDYCLTCQAEVQQNKLHIHLLPLACPLEMFPPILIIICQCQVITVSPHVSPLHQSQSLWEVLALVCVMWIWTHQVLNRGMFCVNRQTVVMKQLVRFVQVPPQIDISLLPVRGSCLTLQPLS